MMHFFFNKVRAHLRLYWVILTSGIVVTVYCMTFEPPLDAAYASPQRGADGKFRNLVAETPRGFWGEVPFERIVVAAQLHNVPVLTPLMGMPVNISEPALTPAWWQSHTESTYPPMIVSVRHP